MLSNVGGADSIPGQEAKIPHASQSKNQNIKRERERSNIETDSTKTVKIVHIKKIKQKNF